MLHFLVQATWWTDSYLTAPSGASLLRIDGLHGIPREQTWNKRWAYFDLCAHTTHTQVILHTGMRAAKKCSSLCVYTIRVLWTRSGNPIMKIWTCDWPSCTTKIVQKWSKACPEDSETRHLWVFISEKHVSLYDRYESRALPSQKALCVKADWVI